MRSLASCTCLGEWRSRSTAGLTNGTRRRTRSRSGFTLLETVVVLVIVGITSSITVGKIYQLMLVTRIQRAATSVRNDMEGAFALAVRNRRPMRISWNSSTQQMTVTDRAGTTVFRRTNLTHGVVRPPIVGRELLRVADRGVSGRFRERHAHHHDQPLQSHEARFACLAPAWCASNDAFSHAVPETHSPRLLADRGHGGDDDFLARHVEPRQRSSTGLAVRGRNSDLAAKRNAVAAARGEQVRRRSVRPPRRMVDAPIKRSRAGRSPTRAKLTITQTSTVALFDQDHRDPVARMPRRRTRSCSTARNRRRPRSARVADMTTRRSGFTLAEVMVSLVIAAHHRRCRSRNCRCGRTGTTTTRPTCRAARSIARSATNVLLADLRMVQDSGGVDLGGRRRKIDRVSSCRTGLGSCAARAANITTVSMLPTDSAMVAASVYRGFAFRDSATRPIHLRHAGQSDGERRSVDQPPRRRSARVAATGQAQIRTVSVNGRTGDLLDLQIPGSIRCPGSLGPCSSGSTSPTRSARRRAIQTVSRCGAR